MDRKPTQQPGKAKAAATQAPAPMQASVMAPTARPKVVVPAAEAIKAVALKVEALTPAAPKVAASQAVPVATVPVKVAAKASVTTARPTPSLASAVPETVRVPTAQNMKTSQQKHEQVRESADNFNASADVGMRQAVTGFQALNAQALDLCMNQGKAQINLATALVATKNPGEAAKLTQEFTQTQFKAWKSFGEALLQTLRQSGAGMFKA